MIYSAYFALSLLLASHFLVAATDVLVVAEQVQQETSVASDHAIALEYKAIVIGERQAIKLPLRDTKKDFGNLEALQVACFQDSEMPTLRAMVQGLIYKANNLLPQNKQVKMPKLVFFIKKRIGLKFVRNDARK